MTTGNFNWYLHTMLFYHTPFVLKKQARKAERTGKSDSNSDDSDDSDSDSDNDH